MTLPENVCSSRDCKFSRDDTGDFSTLPPFCIMKQSVLEN
jgi:hypothetical protein